MKIKDYSFGKISIDLKTYTSDLIICPDMIIHPWRRIEGHILQSQDLKEIIHMNPDIIVVGTGYFGRMRVAEELINFLNQKAVIFYIKRTPDAVSLFNSLLDDNKKTIACLHLSC